MSAGGEAGLVELLGLKWHDFPSCRCDASSGGFAPPLGPAATRSRAVQAGRLAQTIASLTRSRLNHRFDKERDAGTRYEALIAAERDSYQGTMRYFW
jgi:hypothetical protein